MPLFACREVVKECPQLMEGRGGRMVGFGVPKPPSASSHFAEKDLVGLAAKGLAETPNRKE